jgi:predicted transcriptional regulator
MDDNEMVMRSVYLWPTQDSELRQLAHDLNVTKSDLIRSAIGVKLREWLQANDDQGVRQDLEVGRRDGGHERGARSPASTPAAQAAGRRTSKKVEAKAEPAKPEGRAPKAAQQHGVKVPAGA